MPIEFRCTRCQKLLRTQDDTAGKQAKCPQCGTIVEIPAAPAAAAPPPAASSVPPVQDFQADPLARPAVGSWGTAGGGSANPYQSPSYAQGYAPPPSTRERDGPPWERDGASWASFVETVKAAFGNATDFFATMRRHGGLVAPLGFGFLGSLLGAVATMIYTGMVFLLAAAIPDADNGGEALLGFGIILGCMLVVLPLGAVLGMFLFSAVSHLTLFMLGGANQTYETTFRVVAYSMGTTSVLQLIPCCGSHIGGIVAVVFTIIGLSQMHETTGWKAAGAVLLPITLCCGLYLAGNVALMALEG